VNGKTAIFNQPALVIWGKVQMKREKLRNKNTVKANFRSMVYFLLQANENENNNSLIKEIIAKF
jgi:hypothetical protein